MYVYKYVYRYLPCDLPFRIDGDGFPARRGRGLLHWHCTALHLLLLSGLVWRFFALAFPRCVSSDAVKRRAQQPESALCRRRGFGWSRPVRLRLHRCAALAASPASGKFLPPTGALPPRCLLKKKAPPPAAQCEAGIRRRGPRAAKPTENPLGKNERVATAQCPTADASSTPTPSSSRLVSLFLRPG
ncbi:hypothetical protein GGI42DRAFT_54710 [Trichoderma sp. SZMC 28013]